MQPLQRAFLQVHTDLNELSAVLSWFDQFNGPPISERDWLQCQLVLVEGFTNAVRHAHKDRPIEVLIDLEVMVFAERIEIRIWDYGDSFDLAHKLEQVSSLFDGEAEGGRGLQLMQRLTDALSYTRSGDRNCLLIVKTYAESNLTLEWTEQH